MQIILTRSQVMDRKESIVISGQQQYFQSNPDMHGASVPWNIISYNQGIFFLAGESLVK